MSVDDICKTVATRLMRLNQPLDFRDPIGCHRGYFIRRRAEYLGGTFGWSLDKSVDRIMLEHTELAAVVSDIVDALRKDATGHLSLFDLTASRSAFVPAPPRHAEAAFRKRRLARAAAILWRCAASFDLWRWGATDINPAELDQDALRELLNRRLRLVERLNLQVGQLDAAKNTWHFTGSGVRGPWDDGYRVRILELPVIPDRPRPVVNEVVSFIGGAANVAPFTPAPPPWVAGDPEWRWENSTRSVLRFSEHVHFGPGLTPQGELAFTVDSVNPALLNRFSNAVTLRQTLDGMMDPQSDWWQRSWLTGSMSLCFLQLEALMFGLRERFPGDGAERFDVLAQRCTKVGPFDILYPLKPDELLAGTGDSRFEVNNYVEADLQIGDQVRLSSHYVHALTSLEPLSGTEAVITDLESNPVTGSIKRSSIKLQSPGTPECSYATYLQTIVAPQFNRALDRVRAFIAANPSAPSLPWNGVPGLLIRWDPYEVLPAPGAWWVRIGMTGVTSFVDYRDPREVRGGIIVADLPRANDFTPPPASLPANGYFPLYVPNGYDGWKGYFVRRAEDTTHRAPPPLKPFRADGSILSSLVPQGPTRRIHALRPGVMPSDPPPPLPS